MSGLSSDDQHRGFVPAADVPFFMGFLDRGFHSRPRLSGTDSAFSPVDQPEVELPRSSDLLRGSFGFTA